MLVEEKALQAAWDSLMCGDSVGKSALRQAIEAYEQAKESKQPSISEGDAIYSAGCILAKHIKPWLEARDAAEEIITALKPYLNITEE